MQAPLQLFKPFHSEALETSALAVLRSGQIASGPNVRQFELELGRLLGSPHVVTTNDMSSALQIALHLAGVGPHDEVLTTAYNCMSSNAPIATADARPRWVDIDPMTGLMDPASLAASISPRSKACVLYHAAGYPARAQAIADICRRHGIALIEDCNNALGARIGGTPVGAFGDMAVYSFYPNRQINAGDGGAIALRDPDLAQRAMCLRRFGIDMHSFRDELGEINPASDIPEIGWSAAMSNLNAALGLAQLPGLTERMAATGANAAWLSQQLVAVPGLQIVAASPASTPAYWGLLILAEHRDAVLRHLKRNGVMASKLHERTDRYSGFKADPSQALPGTASFMERVLALPCGWWLNADDLERIRSTVVEAAAFAASGQG